MTYVILLKAGRAEFCPVSRYVRVSPLLDCPVRGREEKCASALLWFGNGGNVLLVGTEC